MGWQVESIDRDSLATELLPLVKSHCRVDFSDDDVVLTTYIKIAIGQLERVWGFSVFAVDGDWTPLGQSQLTGGAYPDRVPTPVQPVSVFEAFDDLGADISIDFYLVNAGSVSVPTYLATKSGDAFPSDVAVDLTAGYATVDDLPPEALGAILQVTARLYEFRESIVAYSVDQMPMWMNDIMVGLWQPRC